MTQAMHIFKKDLRRLRWAMLGWCAIVAARTLVATVGAEISLASHEMHLAVNHLDGLLAMVYLLFHFVLVSRLVHDEPLASRDAFWITRPIAPSALLAAKLAFAAVFFLLLPLASSVIIVAWFGSAAGGIAHTIPVFLLNHLVLTTVMMALAVLTPSLMAYIMSLVGIVTAGVLLTSLLVFVALFFPSASEDGSSVNIPGHTVELVTAILIIVAGVAVIAYQYRRRRLGRALIIAGAGVIAVFMVPGYWPWSMTSYGALEKEIAPPNPSALNISLDASKVIVTDASSFGRTPPRKDVSAPVSVSGVPADFSVRTIAARSRLQLAGGNVLQTPRSNPAATLSAYVGGSAAGRAVTVQTVLGGARLLTQRALKDEESTTTSPTLLRVDEGEFVRYRSEAGRLTVNVDVVFERPVIRATLALTDGSRVNVDDVRFSIERVLRRPTGCTVVVRQSSVESLFSVPRYRDFTLILVNRERREAVESDQSRGSGVHLNTAELYMSSPSFGGRGFVLSQYELGFPARGSHAGWIDLSDEWFRNAELVILEFVGAGQVMRTITVDKFRMTP